MALQPVEAVFFFRWTKQVSQAVYMRGGPGTTRYTKNYIQVSGDAVGVLDGAFHRFGDGEVDIEFVWPTGTEPRGLLRPHRGEAGKVRRLQLVWKESRHAPLPWKLGNLAAIETTIPGNPGHNDEADADRELERVEKANLQPWLLGVKIAGEEHRLHCRAYLANPPSGREHTGIQLLPAGLLAAIEALPAGVQSGVYVPTDSPAPTPRATAIVSRVLEALEHDPNVLLVGPPGTGKTVALEDLRAAAEHAGETAILFDPERWHDAFEQGQEAKAISLVFHPSYAYENFVAALVPSTDELGHLRLTAHPGPLVSLAQWTASSDRRALLIIDEFNRGPTAAIFGDTLALIDAEKRHDPATGRAGAHIARPYVGTPMLVAPEYADVNGDRNVPNELRLPVGVRIVAALNSSDRSVAPLDAALRRRFAILSVMPDLAVLAAHLGVPLLDSGDVFAPANPDPIGWTDREVKELALHLLVVLNERIASVLGDDFLLGHALFWPLGDATPGELRAELCRAFDQRILASLRLTFSDQDDLLAAVLGTGSAETVASGDRVAAWRPAPAAVADVAGPHLEVRHTLAMDWPAAARSLEAILHA
jgi:5-methylcytosine-specific restriction protein B